MIFASKIITSFLVPPGCFILALFVLFLVMKRRYRLRVGFIALFLYLFSIQPVSDFLLKPLEDAFPSISSPSISSLLVEEFDFSPDAIVVLGGGTIMGSPDEGGYDSLGADALKRAVYAFNISRFFPVPIIFSGGKVFDYGQESEAEAAQRLFVLLGWDMENFIAEGNSRNTWENAKETAALGIDKAVLVTSAYHMRRSVYCFEQNGITVLPAPTDYKTNRGRRLDLMSFLPSIGSLVNSYLAFHEHIGLLYYILAYGVRS